MKLARDLLEVAAEENVVISEDGNDFVFTGTGTARRLSIKQLMAYTSDGLDGVARHRILQCIKFANIGD